MSNWLDTMARECIEERTAGENSGILADFCEENGWNLLAKEFKRAPRRACIRVDKVGPEEAERNLKTIKERDLGMWTLITETSRRYWFTSNRTGPEAEHQYRVWLEKRN